MNENNEQLINLNNENIKNNIPINNYPFNNYNFGMFSPFNTFNSFNGIYSPFFNNNISSFFDKLFMTFERANYQLYHLCEIIHMIDNQKQTLKYFYSLLKQICNTLIKKYFFALDKLKLYLFNLKYIFNKNNSIFTIDELNNHIKILNFLIKVILSLFLLKFIINFFNL